MALNSVCIGNFKGVFDTQTIPLKPITLLIGPNSSGKSSVIHALAALAQTVNLPNNTRPLVLDDEFAYVHLGRFIEIIHSKNYTHGMTLGVTGGKSRIRRLEGKTASVLEGEPTTVYTFKSTRRTQDLFVESAVIQVAGISFELSRKKTGKYSIIANATGRSFGVDIRNGFAVDPSSVRFDPQTFAELNPLFSAERTVQQELRKTLYLGPFRQPPQRRYPTRGSAPREVGPRGEATVTLLANEMVQSKVRKHTKQVSEWFGSLGLAKNLSVSRVGGSDLFDVKITLEDGKQFPLADLGYGFSQILPVLTQLSFAPDQATVLFEQPELHLHTLAVRPLAGVFIDAYKKKGLHIIAETHSPELFGEFLVEMRKGNLKPSDFVAYKVVRKDTSSKITPIEIDLDDFDVYEIWKAGLSERC